MVLIYLINLIPMRFITILMMRTDHSLLVLCAAPFAAYSDFDLGFVLYDLIKLIGCK